MPAANASSNSSIQDSSTSTVRGRAAAFRAAVGHGSINCFGWSGERILVSVGSTLGGLTLRHGSTGMSSSSSAWSSIIFRLTKWSLSVEGASRLESTRMHLRIWSGVRSVRRIQPMTSMHAWILPARVRYVVGLR